MSSTHVSPAVAAMSEQAKTMLSSLPANSEFSDDELESFYVTGYELAQVGQYQQASNYISLAAIFRPSEPKYLRAMAVIQGKLGQHEKVMKYYRVLDAVEPCNPGNILAMAETELRMKKTDAGRSLLTQLIKYCELFDRPGPELDRARALLQLLDAKAGHAN